MADSPVSDPRVGTVISDRYRLRALIGEGGMGRVYDAEHVLMKKRLAVKILHRELTRVPEVVARFEREAMAAANIDHPNVAAATDFGKLEDGSVFLVLEFVSGTSLRDEIAKGPLTPVRALTVARQICLALGAAHVQGIVHRDLKPENVMLIEKAGEGDVVKVLDFGIAKVPIDEAGGDSPASGAITKAGMVYGTPEYMPPEQALGQSVDARADLYALGVVLYEMLCGVRPFSGETTVSLLGQQLSRDAPPIAVRVPGRSVPPSAERIALALLAREAAQRPASAAEVAGWIEGALGEARQAADRLLTLATGTPPISALAAPGLVPSDPRSSDPALVDARGSAPSMPSGIDSPLPSVASFTARVDAWLAPLRPRFPAQIREVPSLTLLGVAAAIPLVITFIVILSTGVLVGSAAVIRHRAASPAPALSSAPVVASTQPVPALVEVTGLAAARQGVEQQPKSALARKHYALALSHERRFAEVVTAAREAIALDAALADDRDLADAVRAVATEPDIPDASLAALSLLEKMGTRGADAVFDVVTAASTSVVVRQRAEVWLRGKDFQRVSSPELNIAVALHTAPTCPQIHGLLPRAKNVGDERSLRYLEAFARTTGCGKAKGGDCLPCLRKDDALQQATDGVKARVGK